jgi:hypothetical protein
MRESGEIALWAAALAGGCLGILALQAGVPPLESWPLLSTLLAPVTTEAPTEERGEPPVAALPPPAALPEPPAAPPAAATEPVPILRVSPPRPARGSPPLRPRPGDNEQARRYTDALNALSYEGYSGVDWIAPLGNRFRAAAIYEGRRVEVLIDPDAGTVEVLAPPR